jgi:thymidylate synthase (FAD)
MQEAEKKLWMRSNLCFKIHEHGQVKYIDHMGSDYDIDAAARISYSSNKVKTITKSDKSNLIRRLVMDQHTSPIEMVEIKVYIKMPIFVMRQLIRHRTHSVNEFSARYSVMPDEFYITNIEDIKPQSLTNKQGREESADFSIQAQEALSIIQNASNMSYEAYQKLLKLKVARETARSVLPVNIYTEVVWKQNLHNMLHLLRLRLDKHAQKEIRDYAAALYAIAKEIAPLTVKAWEDYVLNSVRFSVTEKSMIAELLNSIDDTTIKENLDSIVERYSTAGQITSNEASSFKSKINAILNSK